MSSVCRGRTASTSRSLCRFWNWLFNVGVLLLTSLILLGCAPLFVQPAQPTATSLRPLTGSVAQTFRAYHAGLTGVDVFVKPTGKASVLTVRLRARPDATEDMSVASAPADQLRQGGFVRLTFPPLRDAHGTSYTLLVEGRDVAVGTAPGSAYADGNLYANGEPQDEDLSFRLVYHVPTLFADLIRFGGQVLVYALLALWLFGTPGLAMLTWLDGPARDWKERLGLAVGISAAIYPLLFLWAYLLKWPLGRLLAYAPATLGTLALMWHFRFRLRERATWTDIKRRRLTRRHILDGVFLLLLGLLLVTRLLPVRSMNAPAWGDSLQHTFIVQLILENGGLFQDWDGYAPIRSLTYHFGFHTLMAVWAWVTGLPAPQAVLTGAQVLNVLAVLALYPLAVRISGGSQVAGLTTLVVAGLLSPMPGFYVNWGRYTQLAGQTLLPVALWLFDAWWNDQTPNRRTVLFPLVVVLAGLAVTHYRVILFAAAGALAWGLWGLWRWRHDRAAAFRRTVAFGGAGLAAFILVAPWLWHVRTGRLPTIAAGFVQQNSSPARVEIQVWHQVSQFMPLPLGLVGLLALLVAWRHARAFAVPLTLWMGFTFLITNPFLVGLPGTGMITNFALVIALYMPVALLAGWLAASAWARLCRRTWRAALVLLFCGAAGYGTFQQLRIVQPFFQMVTPADLAAFEWIRANTPPDARFLVNGFLAYNNSVVVGSDAGWWLPLYTRRANTIPPLLYAAERLAPGVNRKALRQLEIEVRASNGDPAALRAALCRAGVTHVYLGQKRGRVGFGATPLIPEAWLRGNPDFQLLFQRDSAQVWRFDTSRCVAVE